MIIPAPAFDPEATLEAVAAQRCTSLYGVPTMFIAELGHPRFDDFDLTLVEYLLRGKTDGEMADIIRHVYPPEKADMLLPTLSDRTTLIKNSIVFSPLLND